MSKETLKELQTGVTKLTRTNAEEIYEAAQVAVAMGGGPSLAYTATQVRNAVVSFSENKFSRVEG